MSSEILGLSKGACLIENYWIDWNGAIMVPHSHSLVARIFANIFVWSILVYGLFFIAIYKVRLAAGELSAELTS